MESVQTAADAGTSVDVRSTCERPEPVAEPVDLTRLPGPDA
jgi:hypothetical protein